MPNEFGVCMVYGRFCTCDDASQAGEALIHSLSAFILKFLCNARNPVTKQCIKIFMKADSVNESVFPQSLPSFLP